MLGGGADDAAEDLGRVGASHCLVAAPVFADADLGADAPLGVVVGGGDPVACEEREQRVAFVGQVGQQTAVGFVGDLGRDQLVGAGVEISDGCLEGLPADLGGVAPGPKRQGVERRRRTA